MISSVYSTGTASVSNGSPIVTGIDTAWGVALVTGGMFSFAGQSVPIISVESDTSLTLAYGWPGAAASGGYAIARETSEAVRAAWINDRLAQILTKLSLAGIHPDGAGTLAERNALSPVPAAGYLWLRVEIGYGLDIYRRTASGWDGPFGLTGPEGPAGVLHWIEAGWTTATEYTYNDGLTRNGTSYRCFVSHTSGAATEPGAGANWQTVWKITAAKGDSFRFRGAYSGATAYAANDVVRDGGSSWVALQATTGNAPPTLPATANAFWELMAVKGTDGTGTGDVVGPASSADGQLALFDGPTGRLLKGMAGSPSEGDILYRGASGWMRLAKGAVGQFLRQNTALTAPEWVTPPPIDGFRNKIINGDFDVWQRATTQTSNGYGSADRWVMGNGITTKVTSLQSHIIGQTAVPGNPANFCRTVVTSVAGATAFCAMTHKIENVTTFQGKKATVTFYAKANAAKNIALELSQMFGTGGSTQITDIEAQKFAIGTTWTKCQAVVNVPSILGKTLGAGNALQILLWFDAGSNFNARTNNLGQQSGTFDISHVSLVEGDATAEADPFTPRHIQQELALCHRYFEILGSNRNLIWLGNANVWLYIWQYLVNKRASPTLFVGAGSTAGTTANGTIASCSFLYTNASASYYVVDATSYADSEL